MVSGRRNFTRNVEDTTEKIGDALGSVAGTIRDTHKQVVSFSEDALDRAQKTVKKSRKQLHRLAADLQDKGSEFAHQASALASQTRRSIHKARLRTQVFIAEKPATAVAIVAGAAFLGGFLLGTRRRK